MWCLRPPWRIGIAGVHIKEEIIIYIYSYIWDWSDWVCIVRKESQPLTPNPVFLVIFLLSAPFLIIHLACLVKWNFLEHPSFEIICIYKVSETFNCVQDKIPMIQLVFDEPLQCDSKVSPQNYFHDFSLVGLCKFPTIFYALFKPLYLYPVGYLDIPTLQPWFTLQDDAALKATSY